MPKTPRSLTVALAAGCLLTSVLTTRAQSEAEGAASRPATQPARVVTYGLTSDIKLRADRLISVFENDTIEISYEYIENIHDGRGFTAGRAGFCTGTGDFLEVVSDYTKAYPANPLAKYLPRLQALAQAHSDATTGLDGIEKAWAEEAKKSEFHAAQDAVVDRTYYGPAMDKAKTLGLALNLSKAELYDTIIQHGDGDDPDGLDAIIKRTNKAAKGTPATGVSETHWLDTFLKERKAVLKHATDRSTRAAWAQSTGRVDVFKKLLTQKNLDLVGPLKIHVNGGDTTVP